MTISSNTDGWRGGQEPTREAPPAHLMPVLRELLAGTLDVTASRRLNMSPRTFNRRVAELLRYLGASTRFQGGVQAVARGLAPVPHGRAAGHQPGRGTSGGGARPPERPPTSRGS
ncbi:hypothetical protein GCM10023263_81920 [Phytohabitans rumicis]